MNRRGIIGLRDDHPSMRVILLPLLAFLCGGEAFAYSRPCYQEIQAYCAKVEQGDGRWTACAVSNRAHYLAACRVEVHAVIEQRPHFILACKETAAKLCSNIKLGGGRLYSCLKFNFPEVSQPCKQYLE